MTAREHKLVGWGMQELTAFFDHVRRHHFATFANHREEVAVLERIDSAFLRVGSNLLNPKDHLTPFFLFRSHSAFRAACACAMGGQTVETFVLLRSCLEFAAYALQIDQAQAARQRWLDRMKDDASRKAASNAFRTANLRPTTAGCDAKLGKLFDTFYQRCIEHGAHPNEHAVMGSLELQEREGGTEVRQIYLHKDGAALRAAVKGTAEIGLCALFILQHVSAFTARFELLGVKQELQGLRKVVDGMYVPKRPSRK
jgi:hypothetical protein